MGDKRPSAIWTSIRALLANRDGSVAVEMAVALSAMLLIYMNFIDFSRAYREKARLVRLSSTVSNLVALQSASKAVTPNSLDSIFDATASIMTPFSAVGVHVTLSDIELTPLRGGSCCDAKVRWSVTRGGQLRPCNVSLTQVSGLETPAPTNILTAMVQTGDVTTEPSADLVIADVSDSYTPMFQALSNLFNGGFRKTTYAVPRSNGAIALQGLTGLSSRDQGRICF